MPHFMGNIETLPVAGDLRPGDNYRLLPGFKGAGVKIIEAVDHSDFESAILYQPGQVLNCIHPQIPAPAELFGSGFDFIERTNGNFRQHLWRALDVQQILKLKIAFQPFLDAGLNRVLLFYPQRNVFPECPHFHVLLQRVYHCRAHILKSPSR